MHEHVDHNDGGTGPQVDPAETPAQPTPFPGTEPIDGVHEPTEGSAVEPGLKKSSWAERRAARKAASAGESPYEEPGSAALAWLTWDVRAKIAVVLSFLILVTVLIVNRNGSKKKVATDPPDASVANSKNPDPKAAKEPETEPKPPEPAETDRILAEEKAKAEKAEELRIAEQKKKDEAALLAKNDSPPELPKNPLKSESPIVESPPLLPATATDDAEKAKAPSSAIEEPPDISAVAKNDPKEAKKNEPTLPPEPPPVVVAAKEKTVAEAPPAEAPAKPVEVPKPAETPVAEAPKAELKPIAVPVAEAPKGEVRPVEPSPTLPTLSPTPSTATEVAKEPGTTGTPLVPPVIAAGGGFSIPKGRPPATTDANPTKINSVAVETTLVAAPSATKARPTEAAPTAPQPPPDDGKGGETYVVRRGDNFFTISQFQYGSGKYYKALWYANRDIAKTPEDLYVGTAIRIPDFDDLNPKMIEAPKTARVAIRPSTDVVPQTSARDLKAERTSAKPDATLPGTADSDAPTVKKSVSIPKAKEPKYREYVVRGPYETLRSIARRELGSSEREDEIYRLNESRFDEDSAKLKVGMTLKLPADTKRQ